MTHVNIVTPRREDGSPSNWDRYLDLLIRRQVPAKSRQWYIRRVEEFLKDLKPAGLSALTPDQVTDYLRCMSARADLADWQVRQIVDALHRLLVDLAQVPAGKGVDWDCWWEGQRTLRTSTGHRAEYGRKRRGRCRSLRDRRPAVQSVGTDVSDPGRSGTNHPCHAVLDPNRAVLRRLVSSLVALSAGASRWTPWASPMSSGS
jgi:hypothetical protein